MLFVSVILGGAASCRLAGFTVPSERSSVDGSAHLDVGSLGCQLDRVHRCPRERVYMACTGVFLLSGLAFQTVDKPWPWPPGGKEESSSLAGSARAAWAQVDRVSVAGLLWTSGSGRGTWRGVVSWGRGCSKMRDACQGAGE